MAARHETTYVFNTTVDHLRAIILSPDFSSFLNIALKSENPTPSGIWFRFHHGTTFTSWGEKITLTLVKIKEETTQVIINSECGMPTQVIDWGKNKQNVTNIYKHLYKLIFTAPPAAEAQPIYAAAPKLEPEAPKPEPEAPKSEPARAKFCHHCGAPVKPDANFCSSCGTKLN